MTAAGRSGRVSEPDLPRSDLIDPPRIVQTAALHTAVVRVVVTRAEIASAMGPAIAEVLSVLAAQNIAPAGPCFSLHAKRPTDVFDFEVGFPVSRAIEPAGRAIPSRLPAAKVVRTTYRGAYEGLGDAWGALCAWIAAEGLIAQDGFWESYSVAPDSSPNPADWRTELNRPLAA